MEKLIPYLRAVFLALTLLCAAMNSSYAQTVRLTQASISEGVDLSGTATASLQQLPHSWNSDRPQRQGVYTYHLRFDEVAIDARGPSALYFTRLGNRYQIWLNDKKIATSVNLNHFDWGYINTPLLVPLLDQDIKKINELKIVVSGDIRRYAGVSSIYYGELEQLRLDFQQRYFFQQLIPYGIIFLSFSLCFLTFIFGLKNKNIHVFIFGAGSFFWSFATAFELLVNIPFNYNIWLFVYDLSFAISISCMALSFSQIIKFKHRWFVFINCVYLFFAILLTLLYIIGFLSSRQIFLTTTLALAFLTASIYFYLIINRKNKSQSFLLTVLASSAAILGLYDQINIFINPKGYEVYSLVRYVYLIFSLVVFSVFSNQYFRMTRLIDKTNARLQVRLKHTKAKLNEEYLHKAVREHSLSLASERARMTQDMHDGLGSQLISLQQAVKDPKSDPDVLSNMVKSSIAELRFAINAMGRSHTQVSAMLGALRDRLELLVCNEQRTLEWAVDHIPVLAGIDHLIIDQLEKMILEVFTNISKHSNATAVKLSASLQPNSTILISIIENGSGYLPSAPSPRTGRGLDSLASRAKAMNAILTIEQNGCVVLIKIPVASL